MRTYENNTSVSIPNRSTITSTIEITDSFSIQDINVILNISHKRDADLDVFLISPSGTRIELFTDVGGSGDNFTNTELDDASDTSITDGNAPFTGVFLPEGDLSSLEAEAVNGTWMLEVTDDQQRQTGTLNSWSLVITESVPLLASGFEGAPVTAGNLVPLAQQDLQATADAAVQRWTTSGLLDARQLARIELLEFEIADLAGATLGLTTADTIYIDVDAAGYGWYVDPTPTDDAEFRSTRDGALVAEPYSDATGRMDLLSAVIHEIGHFVGFEHGDAVGQYGAMAETLEAGERTTLSGPELRSPLDYSIATLFDVQAVYANLLSNYFTIGRDGWTRLPVLATIPDPSVFNPAIIRHAVMRDLPPLGPPLFTRD